jgi:hypothetical protein
MSDVNLDLSSDAFKVTPTKLSFTRGDTSKKFRVGADADLFLQGFPIFVIKTEKIGNSAYNNYDNLNGFVTYSTKIIQLPTSIEVPLGGTSTLEQITLLNRPYTDIELTFYIDYDLYE